ncbi:hypothetical protein B9Z55_023663 [Caenorhabditis nigoni]|uniref:Uncharacterized protein n=1 Tax=Caenorhabditis nigoni TaxID=1611254 RepID=A0A2G5SQW6_9PELO|nr:hypothetical protein B9Z55_023663 [Caenorhabditis nigoni]
MFYTNTVQNAHEQLTRKIRCLEPIEENLAGNHFSGEHQLSEPIYELCSYMPDPKDFNKGYVNGVDMDSDDYTTSSKSHTPDLPCSTFVFKRLFNSTLPDANPRLQFVVFAKEMVATCRRDSPRSSISTSSRCQRRLSK